MKCVPLNHFFISFPLSQHFLILRVPSVIVFLCLLEKITSQIIFFGFVSAFCLAVQSVQCSRSYTICVIYASICVYIFVYRVCFVLFRVNKWNKWKTSFGHYKNARSHNVVKCIQEKCKSFINSMELGNYYIRVSQLF